MDWISRINQVLLLFVGLSVCYNAYAFFTPAYEGNVSQVQIVKRDLPKNSFLQPQEAYDAIGHPFLSVPYHPPQVELPDLRKVLTYHGRNNRPDAKEGQGLLYLSIKGLGKDLLVQSIQPETPIYLVYDRSGEYSYYRFSPNNEKSFLAVELRAEDEQAAIRVTMEGEEGEWVRTPEEHHSFSLEEKELPRFRGGPWELGGIRVDGGLLARQKAKWFGKDLFFERHGGDAYDAIQQKEKITFGEGEEAYFRFLGEGDALVWKEGRWEPLDPNEDTWNLALLQVRKVDKRLIRFNLWDAEGKARMALNLIHSREPWKITTIQRDFTFQGARTRSQATIEVKGERVVVNMNDWLLNSTEGWIKLDTIEKIDAYARGELVGELFVIEGLTKKEGRQMLQGHVYSPSRAISVDVILGADSNGLVSTDDESPQSGTRPESPIDRMRQIEEMRNQERQSSEKKHGDQLKSQQNENFDIEEIRKKRDEIRQERLRQLQNERGIDTENQARTFPNTMERRIERR